MRDTNQPKYRRAHRLVIADYKHIKATLAKYQSQKHDFRIARTAADTGWSEPTVQRVSITKSYAEYCRKRHALAIRHRKDYQAPAQSTPVVRRKKAVAKKPEAVSAQYLIDHINAVHLDISKGQANILQALYRLISLEESKFELNGLNDEAEQRTWFERIFNK